MRRFDETKRVLIDHKAELLHLGVRKLSLFGSVAKNKATTKSDIDILIDFDSKRGLFGFVEVKNYLEELLHCNVDLATQGALRPAFKEKILHEVKPIF
jgi:predicted nucleotidyltransferase